MGSRVNTAKKLQSKKAKVEVEQKKTLAAEEAAKDVEHGMGNRSRHNAEVQRRDRSENELVTDDNDKQRPALAEMNRAEIEGLAADVTRKRAKESRERPLRR